MRISSGNPILSSKNEIKSETENKKKSQTIVSSGKKVNIEKIHFSNKEQLKDSVYGLIMGFVKERRGEDSV